MNIRTTIVYTTLLVGGLIGKEARAQNCSSSFPCVIAQSSGSSTANPNGTGSMGVYGANILTSGNSGTVGVLGANHGEGTGLYGFSQAGFGGRFLSNATGANTAALRAIAQNGGTAVWASNNGGSTATAAWFDGRVFMNGSLVATSDGRLKRDIRDMPYGLDAMLKLRPVAFKWAKDTDGKEHLGFIAQEVEKVLPELVTQTQHPSGSDVMTVNYLEMIPVLLKGMQEQQERIATLEKGRSRLQLSSVLEGSALFGLFPLGLIWGLRRRRN